MQLRLLGRFQLAAPSGEIAIASRKAQALLALLAIASPQGVSRDRAAGLLWGDLPQERARHSLRQALSLLRKQAAIVEAEGEALRLDAVACVADVPQLRDLAEKRDLKSLRHAAALYGGPLLDGMEIGESDFDGWLRLERARLATLAVGAASRISKLLQDAPAAERIAALRCWLELDPCAEEAHRALMGLLAEGGERSAALQQYERCAEALRRHLDVMPAAETTALYHALRDSGAAAATPDSQETGGIPRLAVLPIEHLSGAAELTSVCAALSQELSAHLARLSGFEVVNERVVAAAAAASGADLRRLARGLRVRYLITGSLRRLQHGQMRAAIQLIEGSTAQYLWSDLVDLPQAPSQQALDDLVLTLAGKLDQRLTLAESRSARGRSGSPADAWEIMRQARSVLFSRGWSAETVLEADALYRQAISLQPAFALARAQRALTIALASRWGLIEGADFLKQALDEAERALALEPNRSEVLGYAGCAIVDLGFPERGLVLLERAIEENPGNAHAWASLGVAQLRLGSTDEAIESLRRALHINPADYRRFIWQIVLARALLRRGRKDEAIEAAEAACRSDPNFYRARLALAEVLLATDKPDEAGKALAEARRLHPRLARRDLQREHGSLSFESLVPLWDRQHAA